MAVSEQTPFKQHTGNGTATVFAFDFLVLSAADLDVYQDGALVAPSAYTVSGVGSSSGGTIAFTTAPANGVTVSIVGSAAIARASDLVESGDLLSETLNDEFDRAYVVMRDIAERSVKMPAFSSAGDTLPAPQANRVIGWNAAGTSLVNYAPTDFATVVVTGTAYADKFSGNDSQTSFSLTANPGSVNALDVSLNGITLVPGEDFTVSGTTLTFTQAPLSGSDNILVRYVAAVPVGSANAQDVEYVPSGGVGRSLASRASEIVSVKDYGAQGNGVADDTAAVLAAIAAVEAAGGGTVYFPAGTYIITAPLLCDNSVICLKGAGARATILQVNHTAGPAVQIKWYYSGVEDMQIQGSAARLAATSGNNSGVFFPTDPALAQSRFVNWVRRCIINNHGGQGVYVTGQGVHLDGLRILDVGAHGIYFDNFDADPNLQSGFSEVTNSQIVRCTGHAVCAGINKTTFRLVLDNVDAFDCALTAGVRQSAHTFHLRTENAVVRSCGIGGFQSSPQTPVIGAVYIDGRYPLVYGNRLVDVLAPAITMGAGSDGYDIRSNFVVGVAQPSLDPAVQVDSGCVGGRVSWGFPASVTNVATLNAVNSGNVSEIYGIPLQGYRSNIGRSTVADDTVKSWTFRAETGAAWGVVLLAFGSTTAESCLIAFRAGDASAYCTLLTTATNVNTTTGVLAGTTGTDTKLTVSVSTSGTPTLYLENRRGSSIEVMPTFLSIGRGELGGVL